VIVATGLNKPHGIAINSHREMVVSCFLDHKVSLLDRRGKQIQTYGSEGDSPDQMMYPAGVAVDSDDNVYVASYHKLLKFSRNGRFIKSVGCHGSKSGEFREPKGVRIQHGYVYVCDRFINRIQVLDTDLNFIQTIGSHGSGRGQFDEPHDLDFDSEDKVYINLHKYGNTSSASVPIALDEMIQDGSAKKGDIILMSTFGAGFTWGATLFRL